MIKMAQFNPPVFTEDDGLTPPLDPTVERDATLGRAPVENLSDRELLEELVTTARTLELAVLQLSKSPMFATFGAMMR
jgi:hypothetical protein